jgi:nitrogen fixation/metabolism regulation signal transduction histidine kinase
METVLANVTAGVIAINNQVTTINKFAGKILRLNTELIIGGTTAMSGPDHLPAVRDLLRDLLGQEDTIRRQISRAGRQPVDPAGQCHHPQG